VAEQNPPRRRRLGAHMILLLPCYATVQRGCPWLVPPSLSMSPRESSLAEGCLLPMSTNLILLQEVVKGPAHVSLPAHARSCK